MNALLHDVRYSIRLLRKTPMATLAAVTSLAFCIGANTAVFSLINSLVLRSLPVLSPSELVSIETAGPTVKNQHGKEGLSLPMLRELERGQRVFTGVTAWGSGLANFEVNGVMYPGSITAVDGGYFEVLGVQPRLGRLLTASDVGTPVAVLDHRCWRSRYNSDPNVVGKTILANAVPLRIVGVMPERFAGLEIDEASEAIVPVGFSGSRAYLDPNNRWDIIARLKPGVTLAQAQAQLAVLRWGALLASLPPSLPAAERDRFLALQFDVESAATGVSYLRYRFLRPLQILMALVGLVLLIGCVNLANWTLARASGRRRELGIRIAVGARPARLASQMFLESLLLSAAGATLGVSVAQWAPHFLLSAIWTGHVPPALDTTPDALVLVFMAVVAVITGVLFGLAPARHAWRIDPSVLLEGGARAVRGSGRWTVRSLVAVQMAVSLVLVIGASLFARAIVRLYAVDLGYRTDHVLALELYPRSPYSRLPDRATYYRELSAALGRLPGVQSVGYCNIGPATAYEYRQPVSVPGSAQGSFQAAEDSVGPGFFRMIGMRLLAGREFSWRDVRSERRVAIVSESLARGLFPGRNPIGARIDIDTEPDAKGMEIVGVVNSASLWTPKSQQPMAIYVPVMQSSVRDFSVYLRTTADPNLVAAAARQVLASAGHHYALRTETLERRLDGALVNDRIVAMLAGFLGIVALMLASVGLYGVMDGVVTRREPEIGVRMALGASRAQVLRMVLGNGVALVAPGLVIGILASLAGSRLLGATYEIPRLDPSAIALASAILCSAALLGTWVPAVRASRLDPMSAVRSE